MTSSGHCMTSRLGPVHVSRVWARCDSGHVWPQCDVTSRPNPRIRVHVFLDSWHHICCPTAGKLQSIHFLSILDILDSLSKKHCVRNVSVSKIHSCPFLIFGHAYPKNMDYRVHKSPFVPKNLHSCPKLRIHSCPNMCILRFEQSE